MGYFIKIILIALFFIVSCMPPETQVRRSSAASSNQNRTENSTVRDVLRSPNVSNTRKSIVRTADSLQGVPYFAGGSSPRGFDCSGFVQYVYGKSGISVLRRTDQQYESGRKIPLNRARPGDLVFFQTTSRRISHVGIYVGDGMFIHAPSSGKRVSYTSMENSYWKPRYRGAVTYIR